MKAVLFLTFLITLFSCSSTSVQPPHEQSREPSNEKTHLYFPNCVLSINEFLGINGIYWDVLKQTKAEGFHLEIDDIDYYAGYTNVLRLGDGANGHQQALALAKHYPNQNILSADYRFSGMEVDPTYPNLLKLNVDHTKAFPIPDKSQDLIVMKRGLCACHDVCETCGGLNLGNRSELIGFFMEVIRVLRTSNPDAKAVLQGGVFKDHPFAFRVFIDVIKHFQNHPEVEFVYLKRARNGDDTFFGIMIRPRR